MKWSIHNACRIRDKAQRPSAFKSQPSGRLTCSTPELSAQISTSPKTIKRRRTTPKACPVAYPDHEHDAHCWASSLEQRWKRRLSWLQATNPCISGRWWSHMQRPVVQHSIDRRVKQWKKASSSLYLDELLIQKCKFRHRFTVNF